MSEHAEQHRHLTRHEVAAVFKVSPQTVDRWTAEGRLPAPLKFGARVLYPEGAIHQALAAAGAKAGGVAR
jgi:excisionase family DNA binding protein